MAATHRLQTCSGKALPHLIGLPLYGVACSRLCRSNAGSFGATRPSMTVSPTRVILPRPALHRKQIRGQALFDRLVRVVVRHHHKTV